MGRHADDRRARGVARWIVIGTVVAVLLIAITVGYLIVVRNSDNADTGCEAHVAVAVAAGPAVSPAVTAAVAAYNATSPVVRSLCVKAAVTTVADRDALAGLSSGTWPTALGPAPTMWVPDDRAYLAQLDLKRPDVAAGHPTDPVAWSPVVLAVRNDDVTAAGSLAWSGLPQSVGSSGSVTLSGDRHLVLALPDAAANPATGLAGQSVVAGAVGTTQAVTPADVTKAEPALAALTTGSAPAGATTADALAAVAAGSGNATSVPVAEADLVAFDAAHGGSLTAVHPSGATASYQVIPAPLSGSWVNQDLATAAADVEAYLADPAGQQILADAGWRTAAAKPSHPQSGVDTTAPVTALPTSTPATGDLIAGALGGSGGSTTTATTTPTAASQTTAASITSSSSPATTAATTTATTPPTSTSTSPSGSPTTKTSPTSPTTATSKTTATSTSADPAAKGPVLTILVDTSADLGNTVDGKTLTAWVQEALTSVTDGTITNTVGMWTSSGDETPNGYTQVVTTGLLSGKVGNQTRSAALSTAIAALSGAGSRWIYGAIIAADASAVTGAVANRDDRLVVITTGADTTPNTSRAKVINAVKSGAGAVQVDIIGLGTAVPATAYSEIAAAGGGAYVPVTDPSKLTEAMTDLLTLN